MLALFRVSAALKTRHDTGTLIVTHPPLEEVGLALQRDLLHPVKRVAGIVELIGVVSMGIFVEASVSLLKGDVNLDVLGRRAARFGILFVRPLCHLPWPHPAEG